MDEIARQIGWLVIIGGAFYLFGKWLEWREKEKMETQNSKQDLIEHEMRIALRQIYRSTTDESIHQMVKAVDPSWSLLALEIGDEEYAVKMMSLGSSASFQEAVRRQKKFGFRYVLLNEKIHLRTDDEYFGHGGRRAA